MGRMFDGLELELVGSPQFKISPSSNSLRWDCSPRPGRRPNKYAAGPFCRFVLAKGDTRSGVYVMTVDNNAVYVGKAARLEQRWGAVNYGSISPRNCEADGQSTNCRINNFILQAAEAGHAIQLWFVPTDPSMLSQTEARLYRALKPAWNRQTVLG